LKEEEQLIMLPGPTNVPPRVMRAMLKPIINHRGPEFKELMERLTEDAKRVFGTKGDIVILSSSGTGGVECSLSNIVSSGDKVMIPVHGVFSQRVKQIIERVGGKAVEVPVDWSRAVTIEQIEDALKKEKGTKAIAVVYNETSTGVKTKCLKEVGELCNERGLLFVVDAISILGGDVLPVDNWHVDICVTGSQKCLMCPPGLALLSVSEKAWSTIEKNKSQAHYFNLLPYREFQKEGQTPYTPAIPLFFALDEAFQTIKEEGLEVIFKRHKLCAEALYSAAENLGLELFADREFRSNTVIAVKNPKGILDKDLRELLRKKYRIVIAGGMGKLKGTMFRIGSMGVVSRFEILSVVSALESALADLGYRSAIGEGVSTAREIFEKSS